MKGIPHPYVRFAAVLLMLLVSHGTLSAQAFKQHVVDAHHDSVSSPEEAVRSLPSRYAAWKESNTVQQSRPELKAVTSLDISRILAYDALASTADNLGIRWDERGVPIIISGNPLERASVTSVGDAREHDITVRSFLRRHGAVLGLADAPDSFVLQSARSDELGRSHLRYAQLRDGVPVWGKEIVCGLLRSGDMDVLTGRIVSSSLPVKGSFRLSQSEAIRSAEHYLSLRGPIGKLDADVKALLEYDGPSAEKNLFDDGDCLRPVFVVEIRPNLIDRWHLFVDADGGSILRAYNATCHDGPSKASGTDLMGQTRTLETYLHQGTYFLIDATRAMYDEGKSNFPDDPAGAILTLDAHETSLSNITHVTSTNNSWAEPSSVSAHANAGIVYEYFRTTHQRNAIDDKGGTIISVVNVGKDGQPMENAFWNGKLMAYGNGGEHFDAFAKALDVSAHEMSHGVTEHSAGLEYVSMSGALNEAFSDIFGAMVDREDWKLGEDITRVSPLFPTGTMRDLEDPHNGGTQGSASWQPKHMNEYQNLDLNDDNGGVHTNSGIINHCAFLLAGQIGRDKTEKIMYRALTTKLTKQAQFIDFRLSIIRSAEELYSTVEAQACATACDQVGILDGNPTDDPKDIPPVNGTDRMLFVNTDPNFTETLWIAVPVPGGNHDLTAISQTNVWGRPSISDDGTVAIFVDTDNNIRMISLVGVPNEQVLDNSGIWHSVALSRDGKRLAVTTTERVPEIYVFELFGSNPAIRKFPVSTPNYSGNDIPNTARFVDAMEFGVTDQFLLFDTYNEVTIQGYSLGFWDINIMDVWNTAQNSFGTGRIERILPQDPDINTGNPTFAKTKPTVIAFDLQFPQQGEAYVATMDAFKGEPSTVVQLPAGEIGYPSFSGDDRLLAFAYKDNGESSIYNLPMSPDGVTPTGDPQRFIDGTTVPLWFRTGSRPVAADGPEVRPEGVTLAPNYPNPFGGGSPSGSHSTVIPFTLERAGTVTLTVMDLLGREVARIINAEERASGSHHAVFNPATLAPGLYRYRIETESGAQTRNMLLIR